MGHQGGKRPGAGRPTSLVVAARDNTALANQIKHIANVELAEAIKLYPQLVKLALKEALAGDKILLRYFMELPFKYMMPDTTIPETAIGRLREKWSHTVEAERTVGATEETKDTGPVTDAEYTVVA